MNTTPILIILKNKEYLTLLKKQKIFLVKKRRGGSEMKFKGEHMGKEVQKTLEGTDKK